MAVVPLSKPSADSPEGIVSAYFAKNYPEIYKKVLLQVRRTPRRQTGPYQTNRESRWKLDPKHPDYTAAGEIPRIEAKLFAMALEFEGGAKAPDEVWAAAAKILGRTPKPGSYRCPISGRRLSFREMLHEAKNPKPGRSAFHVGHVRPRARQGSNTAGNTYWTSDLGNRIQGDKSWAETVKIIIEMAEFQRRQANISWEELVNRYAD